MLQKKTKQTEWDGEESNNSSQLNKSINNRYNFTIIKNIVNGDLNKNLNRDISHVCIFMGLIIYSR